MIVAAVILIVLSMALVALLVRFDSTGRALFRQTHVGRKGRRFHMSKFRSMVADADRVKSGLWAQNEATEGLFKSRSILV